MTPSTMPEPRIGVHLLVAIAWIRLGHWSKSSRVPPPPNQIGPERSRMCRAGIQMSSAFALLMAPLLTLSSTAPRPAATARST